MSVNYSASLVVGVVVERKQLSFHVEHRACDHSVGPDADFCPKCGKPKLTTSTHPIDGYDDDCHYYGFEARYLDYDSEYCVIGKPLGAVGFYGESISKEIDSEELAEAVAEMRKTPLETSPFGPVGVHLCMHVD